MAQDVVNLLFAGDSEDLLSRYGKGLRLFREAGGVAPEQVVVAQGDAGLYVTLVWSEHVPHDELGKFLLTRLGELGLPMPRVDHATLTAASWDSLTVC
jgi:hypothetical protein